MLALLILSQMTLTEGVIATVNDEPVLYSEFLDAVTAMGLDPANLSPQVKDSIVDQLLKQKAIIALAREDSTLKVTDEEIQRFADQYINNIVFNLGRYILFSRVESLQVNLNDTLQIKHLILSFGFPEDSIDFQDPNLLARVIIFVGERAFDEELKKLGITRDEFVEENRKVIESQILYQKYISKYIMPKVKVTEQEVREYFETHRDSFPRQPAMYFLQQIVLPVQPSFEQEEKAYLKAKDIYRKIEAGASYERMARRYSKDTLSAKKGGDLGYIPRIVLQQSFSPDAYYQIMSTPEGGITRPIRGPRGYNIFKVVDKSGDSIRLKNIFIPVEPSAQDIRKAKVQAGKVIQEAKRDFEGTARKYSIAPQQINLGYIPAEAIQDEEMRKLLTNARQGDVLGPIYRDGFLIILKVKEYIPPKETKFDDVREQIYNMLVSMEVEKLIGKVFEEHHKDFIIKKMF